MITDPEALVNRARQIATEAHAGQTDKPGEAYINHPARVAATVAQRGGDALAVAAGWLHDVVEDTPWDPEGLLAEGFPREVVDAVVAVSKVDGESQQDYARRIAAVPRAAMVKRADMADNTDPARTARLPEETRERLAQKYARMAQLLDEAEGASGG